MAENDRSLLSILKGLYSQLSEISLGLTQVRMNTYKNEAKAPSNITTILHKQIDDLSAKAISENTRILGVPAVQSIEESYSKNKRTKEAKVENVSGVESEFAKHVKQRRPPSITQPQMGENLKSSVWEHIKAAIRHAKNGDVETAKLHTNIAGAALEEAGHYMGNDDYSKLVLQIESYFSEHSE
jgi:hypothetical protein